LSEFEKVATDSEARILQFSEPLSEMEVKGLESIVFSNRPDITLRVFGHYGQICDLSFLKNTPSVRRISADCLENAVGIDVLAHFREIERLAIEIYSLNSFDFLKDVSPSLKELSLGKTSSKHISIESIEHFQNLTYLGLKGQRAGIEVVGKLSKLEKIVLLSISTKNLSFLEGLGRLWSVTVALGSIPEFSALTTVQNLKHLEINQVITADDLSFISDITPLQNLSVQSLKHVEKLPDFHNLNKLRRIYLENLSRLVDMASLQFAPALNELIYVNAKNLSPEDLLPVLKNEKVRAVHCGFGSSKKNSSFLILAQQYEKQPFHFSDFRYD